MNVKRLNTHESMNLIHYIDRSKDKSHVIISVDSEKVFNKA